jgi:hypothetical protein
MALMQDDHVIQAVATDAPDAPLDRGMLPWTLWGDEHFFTPHVLHPLPKSRAIDTVPSAQEIAWLLIPW